MIAPYWEDMSPQRTNSGGVWQYYDAVEHIYIIEFNHDKIITTNVDLENLGKELGVLRDFEELED